VASLSRHYASTVATNAAILTLGIVSGTLAARMLGPVGRGELAVITLWPFTLALLGQLGVNRAVAFFTARQPNRRSALWTAALALTTGQSLLLVGLGYLALPHLLSGQQPHVVELSRLFLLAMPLVLFYNCLLGLLQGAMHLDAYNLSRGLLAIWYTVLMAALFLGDRPHLLWIVAGQLAGYAAIDLLNLWQARRLVHPRWQWDSSAFRLMLSYGAKAYMAETTAFLNLRLDQLVMSVWLSPQDLGLYVVAVTLAMPLTMIPGAIGTVLLPAAARETPAAARRVIRHSLRTMSLLLLASAALLYVLVPYLLPLFFGAAFAPAVTACRVLVLAMVPLGLAQLLYESLRALDRPLAPAYAELLGNGVTAFFLYLLLPRIGFLGAAYASLAAYTASLLFILWYLHARARVPLAELLRSRAALDSPRPLS
jgi:O-antigen/teichoic acid export membrane protein